MNTAKGYKQTDIGVIPEDWDALPISEIASITTGGSDTQDRIDDGEFPFFVRSQKVERINKYTMECEAILTSGDGVGVGKIFHYIDGKFDFHQRVYCIYNFIQSVSAKYLYYQFSTYFFNRVMQLTAKSSVDSVRREMIADMKLPIPKTTIEQTAIANALSDMDALIAQTEKLIEKKKAIKQGVMQELLKPKEGWVTKKLGEVICFQTGFPFSSLYFSKEPNGIRLIKNRDLRSDDSIIYFCGHYIEEFLVNNGDLLIGMDGDFEPVIWNKGIALLNQRVGRVKKKKEVSLGFLAYTLLAELKLIESRTGSTTVKHLSHSDVENIELRMPDYKEQCKIETVLRDLTNEIDHLYRKLNKFKHQKQGMMQALLTGKIRLT